MKRVKLTVAYDGTNYCGWQVQPNGKTIEGILNQELSALLNETIVVLGASRTDSGVHSLGNVAVFDTETKIPVAKIAYALNARLPEDIVIQESIEVDPCFHPRKCKSIKTYEYAILNRRFGIPLLRHHTYFFYRPLNIELMQQAGAYLEGLHDFRSFCSAHAQVAHTIRQVQSIGIDRRDDVIRIQIKGYGFLYNMVRIIAGTLIQVGTLDISPETVKDILESGNREQAGPTAPAHGLTMIGIEYL